MVLTLTGILFVAGSLTSDGIPEISEQALWLWITFVEVMTAMILVTGIIFMVLGVFFRSILSGEGDNILPMKILGLGTLINLILDPILIYFYQIKMLII